MWKFVDSIRFLHGFSKGSRRVPEGFYNGFLRLVESFVVVLILETFQVYEAQQSC